jgi:teichuronic acid exporter
MNIKNDLKQGAFYMFLSKYSKIIIQIIIMGVLARLITPEDFGIVAIAMVFILFFNELNNSGFATAVIQKKVLKAYEVESFFWVTVIQSFLLTIIYLISIPFISKFYDSEYLSRILYLLSISLFFFSVSTIPNAILKRNKQFKDIGIIIFSVNIITGIISILLAYTIDEKIYALIFKVICESILFFILFFLKSNIKIKLTFSLKPVKEMLSYSLFQFSYNMLHYLSRNIDNIIIGKFIGIQALGYYDKAYRLMIMPIQNLSNVITPVVHPVLSRIQDDKNQVIKTYFKLVSILALIGFPISVLLYFSSYEIINILFGSNWDLSVLPFKILSISIGFQMIISTSRSIFQSVNDTKTMFISSLICLIFLLFLMIIGIYWNFDLNQFSLLILIFYLCSFFITFYFLIIKTLRENLFNFLKLFINPLLISFTISIIFVTIPFPFENIYISLIFKFMTFTLSYVILSSLLKEKSLYSVLKHKINLK